MSPALIIGSIIAQHGVPLALAWVEQWSKESPADPQPAEWLELLKRPSLVKTYDQQMADAAKRNAA